MRSDLTWVYVPFSQSDRVTAIGVRLTEVSQGRPRYCYVFRTALLGDFTVGPYIGGEVSAFHVSDDAQLIFTSRWDTTTRPIGVFPRTEPCLDLSPATPIDPPFLEKSSYSFAALKNASRVWIYRYQTTGLLRGLIIDYENGAQKALGSCRIGLDKAEVCERVSRLHFREIHGWLRTALFPYLAIEEAIYPAVEACACSGASHKVGWVWCHEAGVLEMWFHELGMTLTQSTPGVDSPASG